MKTKIIDSLPKIKTRHFESKQNKPIISIQIKFIMILSSIRIETDRRQNISRINQLIYTIHKITMLEHTQTFGSKQT